MPDLRRHHPHSTMHVDLAYLADHRDAIPQLARWTYDHWAAVTPRTKLSVEERVERFEKRARTGGVPTGFVALVDGRVVGMACLVEHDLDARMDLSPWLATVFVATAFRGHGIGTMLSERVTTEAARLGFTKIFLVTYDQEAFYTHLGWSVLARTSAFEYPVTIMVRDLP